MDSGFRLCQMTLSFATELAAGQNTDSIALDLSSADHSFVSQCFGVSIQYFVQSVNDKAALRPLLINYAKAVYIASPRTIRESVITTINSAVTNLPPNQKPTTWSEIEPKDFESTGTPCNPGEALTVYTTTDSICVDCPPGMASDGNGICKFCEPGTYSSLPKQPTCQSASPGGFTDLQTGATKYTLCPAGYFNSLVGFGNSEDDPNACTQAEPGFYTPTPGATTQLQCSPGAFSDSPKATGCTKCPPGTYVSTSAQSSCLFAQKGGFTNTQVGATSYTHCPKGYFNADIGYGSCTPPASCDPNACTVAPAGSYVDSEGATQAKYCLAGQFSAVIGAQSSSVCQNCEPGTYSISSGQSACLTASIGGFTDTRTGATKYTQCPSPYYNNEIGFGTDYTDPNACKKCEPGSYLNANVGAISCTLCSPGSYSSIVGVGSSSCVPCNDDEYAASGATTCSPCITDGKCFTSSGPVLLTSRKECKQDSTNKAVCVVYSKEFILGTCIFEDGTMSIPASMASTGNCDIGHAKCTKPLPSASPSESEINAAKCIKCLPGSASDGSTPCNPCAEGTIASNAGQGTCTLVPSGGFTDQQIGATQYNLCPAGSFQPNVGYGMCTSLSSCASTACNMAPAGTYTNVQGSTTSTPCPQGTYTLIARSINCIQCPAGHFTNAQTMSTSCEPCQPGYYSTKAGAYGSTHTIACATAKPGEYVGTQGATAPTDCEQSKYSSSSGQSSCIQAPPGGFTNYQTGATTYNRCDKGTYNPGVGHGYSSYSGCTLAAPGQYVDTTGATAPKLCDLGQYSALSQAESCLFCPQSTYASSTGQSSCTAAPINTFTDKQYGATTYTSCPSGYFNPGVGYGRSHTDPTACFAQPSRTDPESIAIDAYKKQPTPVSQPCVTDFETGNIGTQESISASTPSLKKCSNPSLGYTCLFSKTNLPIIPAGTGLTFQIPQKLHIVWFYRGDGTPNANDIKSAYQKSAPYVSGTAILTNGWTERIFWTNVDVSALNLPTNLVVKQAFNEVLTSTEHTVLQKYAKLAADNKADDSQIVLATDLMRYLVTFKYGGLYIDGDGKIENLATLESLMRTYTQIFAVETGNRMRPANSFFAVRAEDPTIKMVLDIAYRNLIQTDSAPYYTRYPCNTGSKPSDMKILMLTGPVALAIAYAKTDHPNTALLDYGCVNRKTTDPIALSWQDEYCGQLSGNIVAYHDFGKSWRA